MRARVSVSLLFALYGTILGTWTARIPTIKADLRLTDGELSLGLLAFAVGAITGMQLAGRFIDRTGSARVMVPIAAADAIALTAPGHAPNLVTLAIALYAFGTIHGLLNIAMNAQAVAVERAAGRPIITSFHAVYSIGGFLGAAIGGAFAFAGLSPRTTFLSVAALALAVCVWAHRWRPTDEPAPPPAGDPDRTSNRGVLFLGVLVFCCLVGEGAAADWSAVYLRDNLGSSDGFAAAAYATFSITMMIGRLVGDRLTAALGPVRLVQVSGLTAALGLGAALLVHQRAAGIIGFGLLGLGLACIAPRVFSAAGNREPAQAGKAIARVASLGFTGFVIGPILIGLAAEAVGLPAALAIPAILALFVAASARALRPTPA